jgi:hypothetical protein
MGARRLNRPARDGDFLENGSHRQRIGSRDSRLPASPPAAPAPQAATLPHHRAVPLSPEGMAAACRYQAGPQLCSRAARSPASSPRPYYLKATILAPTSSPATLPGRHMSKGQQAVAMYPELAKTTQGVRFFRMRFEQIADKIDIDEPPELHHEIEGAS